MGEVLCISVRFGGSPADGTARFLTTWGNAQLAALTGVDREMDFPSAETEASEVLLWIETGGRPAAKAFLDAMAGTAGTGLVSGDAIEQNEACGKALA